MSQNRTAHQGQAQEEGDESWWATATAATGAILGVGAVAGLAYLFRPSSSSSDSSVRQNDRDYPNGRNTVQPPSWSQLQLEEINYRETVSSTARTTTTIPTMAADLVNSFLQLGTPSRCRPRRNVPANPVISNLNGLLSDIYVRYVALNDTEFELHYRVFTEIFRKLHNTMKKVDGYYNKYSSTVQFAGSHPDRLRISRPDNDFDVDIVIGLPLNIHNNPVNSADSDIVLEAKGPGFLQLKMGVQFQRLLMRDKLEWLINKAAYEWKDDKNYLLRSKFIDWFKGVVAKALNEYQVNGTPTFVVDGVKYEVRKSESGPAMTLLIVNTAKGFRCDVDLVPALKFPEDRWPICTQYRSIPPGCNAPQNVWMVVPKPNKDGQNNHDMSRSWRIALQDQEAKLMHDSTNMKQAIRLIKKLRDSMGMKKIASYYIKTLFFWEIMEQKQSKEFWSTNSPAFLFQYMVKKLYQAVVQGRIPYFWNRNCNLIGNVDKGILKSYANNLVKLIAVMENPGSNNFKQVAKYLLSPAEFKEYNENILRIV